MLPAIGRSNRLLRYAQVRPCSPTLEATTVTPASASFISSQQLARQSLGQTTPARPHQCWTRPHQASSHAHKPRLSAIPGGVWAALSGVDSIEA